MEKKDNSPGEPPKSDDLSAVAGGGGFGGHGADFNAPDFTVVSLRCNRCFFVAPNQQAFDEHMRAVHGL